MANTQTMLARDQSNKRLDWALQRLLHALKPFMRAYARTPGEQAKVPELDLVWVTDLDGGPSRAVLDVLKSNPELWLHALPPEVCIMPRQALKALTGVDRDVISGLCDLGENIVAAHAAKHLHDLDNT